MTVRHQIELESVMLFSLAITAGLVVAIYNGYRPHFPKKFSLPIVYTAPTPSPTTVPSPSPIPKPQVTSQISPDGTKQLTMTVTTNSDMSKDYIFSTSDTDGTNERTVFFVTYGKDAADSMSIPFNTWSPDNKYFFILHEVSSIKEAIVFAATGDFVTKTDAMVNTTEHFISKHPTVIYDETTGWASETLLLVNTIKPDGTKGTSYWIEIPSLAIIALSTKF